MIKKKAWTLFACVSNPGIRISLRVLEAKYLKKGAMVYDLACKQCAPGHNIRPLENLELVEA